MRETFPYDEGSGYLIFDRAANFYKEVVCTMKSFGVQPKRTSFRSPWQNGVAERWVGNCRHDLLDHVIALNEAHLKRLMHEYIRYYHDDRTHLVLEKRTQRVGWKWRIEMQAARLYRCREWAAYIIVMAWPA